MKATTAVHARRIAPDERRDLQLIRYLLEGEATFWAASRSGAVAIEPWQASRFDRQSTFARAAARMPHIPATVQDTWMPTGPLLRMFHRTVPLRARHAASTGIFCATAGGLGQVQPQADQRDIRLDGRDLETGHGIGQLGNGRHLGPRARMRRNGDQGRIITNFLLPCGGEMQHARCDRPPCTPPILACRVWWRSATETGFSLVVRCVMSSASHRWMPKGVPSAGRRIMPMATICPPWSRRRQAWPVRV